MTRGTTLEGVEYLVVTKVFCSIALMGRELREIPGLVWEWLAGTGAF